METTLAYVVGARPNFIKIAPLLRQFAGASAFRNVLVHTGQHYDVNMSDAFFRELDIPAPDHSLGVGSGSHAEQTGQVMIRLEPLLEELRPKILFVVGDVNSTVAGALTGAKLQIPVAHVEAGLRSGDRSMPEELNRLVTDQLSDLLFTPSAGADRNLEAEGIPRERIHRVGNIMIDTLTGMLPRIRQEDVPGRFGLERGGYAVVTVHRPSNVDDPDQLEEIVVGLERVASRLPVLFPVHPRTRARMDDAGLSFQAVRALDPLAYREMIGLMDGAALVLTDSGGIQEETTALGVPCLTLRPNTERPITVDEGTNRLVPDRSAGAILAATERVLDEPPTGSRPELWDGETAARILEVTRRWLAGEPAASFVGVPPSVSPVD